MNCLWLRPIQIGLITLMSPLLASGSTFVGNGGNAGDVELQVTLNQVAESLRFLRDNGDDIPNACKCTATFKGRAICDPLINLNQEQAKFCHTQLAAATPLFLEFLEGEQRVHISWTNENIQVMEPNNPNRSADAVTNSKNRTITLNQERFLSMSPQERIFLITHELGHMTVFNGEKVEDTQPFGPFPHADGGKQFLNSLGAATAMLADRSGGFNKYALPLSRPQGYKNIWLDLATSRSASQDDSDSPYALDEWSGATLTGRYYFMKLGAGGVGALIETRNLYGDHKVLTNTEVEENLSSIGAGLSYRIFPWKNPLSFWGQTHFVFNGKYEFVQHEVKLNDGFVTVKDSDSSNGLTVAGNYFIPLTWGFWGYVGVSYSTAYQRSYSKIGLKYDKNITSSALGVSYAF